MATIEYLDFEIEISGGEGRTFPCAVIRSPGGEAFGEFHLPYDELALENRLKDLQIALLRSGGNRRVMPSAQERKVQEFGQALFDELIRGEIRSRYDISQREAARQGKGLRLKLRLQPAKLASLPWEFMYDRRSGNYICLSTQTPLVRYIELPQVIQPLTVTAPLRILGVTADPKGLVPPGLANEKQRVEAALSGLIEKRLVHLDWLDHVTWREWQRAMRTGTYHIMHFIGHGGFDPAGDEGFIAIEDEHGELFPLGATRLGMLLADHKTLRLVILNSCEGGQSGGEDLFSSTASILIRSGLPAVLAMQYEITDRAAVEFARGFYEAVADGLPVDAATAEARKSVSLGVNNTIEWGTPVLYMRAPDGVLFKEESTAGKKYRTRIEKQKHVQLRREKEELGAKYEAERRALGQERSEEVQPIQEPVPPPPEPKEYLAQNLETPAIEKPGNFRQVWWQIFRRPNPRTYAQLAAVETLTRIKKFRFNFFIGFVFTLAFILTPSFLAVNPPFLSEPITLLFLTGFAVFCGLISAVLFFSGSRAFTFLGRVLGGQSNLRSLEAIFAGIFSAFYVARLLSLLLVFFILIVSNGSVAQIADSILIALGIVYAAYASLLAVKAVSQLGWIKTIVAWVLGMLFVAFVLMNLLALAYMLLVVLGSFGIS